MRRFTNTETDHSIEEEGMDVPRDRIRKPSYSGSLSRSCSEAEYSTLTSQTCVLVLVVVTVGCFFGDVEERIGRLVVVAWED